MFKEKFESAVIVAGTMTIGWGVAWATFDLDAPTAAPTVEVADSSKELEEVERELDEVRRALQAQAGRGETIREIVREVTPTPSDEPEIPKILREDPDTLSPEEFEQWREADLDYQAKVFDSFDERLANEDRDPDWAPRAEAHILDMTSQMHEAGFSGTELASSECGSASCRAEFHHLDGDEQRSFLHQLVPKPGGEFVQADVRIVPQDDGSLVTEAFFVRHDGVS